MQIQKRYRLEIGQPGAISLLLVGCGGTGSFAALHLARLAWAARRRNVRIRLIFIDPDRVEEKNIGRQNFCPAEVGEAKARALAWRFNLAFGLDITPVVGEFRAEFLRRFDLGYSPGGRLSVVVGAVDTPAARRDIAEAVEEAAAVQAVGVWWLDAGNDAHSGQVLLGNSSERQPQISPLGVCQALPWPHLQEPGLLALQTPVVDPASCAELLAAEVQSLMINQAMAGWLGVYAYRLLLGRDLDLMATYLDQRTGTVRSRAIVEGQVAGLAAAGQVCPECGGPVIAGRDQIDGREIDVLFCGDCEWRAEPAVPRMELA